MSQCQGALIGDGVNFVSSWAGNAKFDWYDRCQDTGTHRVVAGCVHEHVLAWDACGDCAAKARQQADRELKPRCVKCKEIDQHICPVLIQVEELPQALTVLHIRNPRPLNPAMSGPWATADGQTLCGLDLEPGELWQLLEREPQDKVCSRCLNPGSGDGDQGTLL